MGLGKGLAGFGVLAIALLASSTASAHALFVKPIPRDTTDTKLKMGPCGGNAAQGPLLKKAPVEQYAQGALITVDFKETVAHQGCYVFQIANGTADENQAASWTTLKSIDDPTGNGGNQQTTLQLPAGLTCMNCTLRLVQAMNGATMCAGATNLATTPNYYSCADVRIGNFADAGAIMDAGMPDYDAASTDEPDPGGPTTTPTDGGGNTQDPDDEGENGAGPSSRNLQAGKGDDCNVGFGATTGVSVFVTAGIAAMAMLRRRKKS